MTAAPPMTPAMAGPAVAARPVEVEVLVMVEDGPEPVRVLVRTELVEL